ncbi:MAG: SHOCT domain-containing protein [Bacteroidetes bacterium]|jgi:hypothetical protein|nr:SHOCT domain-containing protein [Bacteroidota bacterium]
MRKLMAFVLAMALLAGCASSTMITSTPSEADVYVNGELKGKTPYKHEDEEIIFTKTRIELRKEGHQNLSTSITRDEEIMVEPAVVGFFFWPVWLWVMGYSDEHHYDLLPNTSASPKGLEKAIIDLWDLYSNGILSEAEYAAEKSKVLSKPLEYTKEKVDALKELKSLFDAGKITDAEYTAAKGRVLE